MAVQVTIKVNAIDVLKRFPELEKQILQATDTALAKGALLVELKAKRGAPFNFGRLKNSITTYRDQIGISYSVIPTVNYAVFVHEGHRQEVGRFVPVLGKRLVQPFVAGRPFMKEARDESEAEIREIFQNEIAKAISK